MANPNWPHIERWRLLIERQESPLLTGSDVLAILTQESSGNPEAVGRDSDTNEVKYGLLQLQLADAMGVINAYKGSSWYKNNPKLKNLHSLSDAALGQTLLDPDVNIPIGVRHLEAIAADLNGNGVPKPNLLPFVAVAHFLGLRPNTQVTVSQRLVRAIGANEVKPNWGQYTGANTSQAPFAKHARRVLWNYEQLEQRRRAELDAAGRSSAAAAVGPGAGAPNMQPVSDDPEETMRRLAQGERARKPPAKPAQGGMGAMWGVLGFVLFVGIVGAGAAVATRKKRRSP